MVKTKDFQQFSKAEIELASKFMYDAFTFQSESRQKSLEARIAMLKGYIEVLRQLLYSDLIQTDAQKLTLVEMLDKLIAQKELFELANSDEAHLKNMAATAERFSKKTRIPIGM
ncbi:MAG: hypothetical protein AAB316_10350 [Bacteroidota bacterium]